VDELKKPPTGPAPGAPRANAVDLTRGARIPMLDLERLTTDPDSAKLDSLLFDEVSSSLGIDGEKEKKIALAMMDIFYAWTNEGVNPRYHRAAQDKLKIEWPTLYEAITNFVEASKVGDE
jgi:glutamate synthase domain-containing protein 1